MIAEVRMCASFKFCVNLSAASGIMLLIEDADFHDDIVMMKQFQIEAIQILD